MLSKYFSGRKKKSHKFQFHFLYFLFKLNERSDMSGIWNVAWSRPEILLVTHFHSGLTQHSNTLGVLQPQRGLQKFERLAGELLVDSLDLCLEADADKHTEESLRVQVNRSTLQFLYSVNLWGILWFANVFLWIHATFNLKSWPFGQ